MVFKIQGGITALFLAFFYGGYYPLTLKGVRTMYLRKKDYCPIVGKWLMLHSYDGGRFLSRPGMHQLIKARWGRDLRSSTLGMRLKNNQDWMAEPPQKLSLYRVLNGVHQDDEFNQNQIKLMSGLSLETIKKFSDGENLTFDWNAAFDWSRKTKKKLRKPKGLYPLQNTAAQRFASLPCVQ